MSTPLVSVIIPAYNHERFIGAAVESVLGQTCADLELIVIDDGSRDRTGEVVQSYTDLRLSYYHQENQDAFNTINRGLGLARGEYTAILNSDDVYALDRLQRLVEYRNETGAECLFTDVIPISDEGEEFTDPAFGWNLWHQKNRAFYRQCGDLYTAFLKGNFMVTTSNLFMTTRAVRAVGKFCSLRYLHDYDYIFRMLLANPGQVRYLQDEKLLYYRIHAGNTLGEAAIAGRLQDQDLIRKYLLEVIPAAQRGYVAAGTDRLVELEQELQAVRAALQPAGEQGVRPAVRQLQRSLKAWLRKKLG
ncbi:glycosyltransferase [Desulfoprunum benzoelyticum]|uniref:Glycosyltransferase involved in cell wall biosynthesis n=1 Tax=Desulfoprunum benzoelyticum TaxID=1506996 RepID=A0A840UYR6_9BACT|nr:glycosyltransferase [Desulfoprunum benzoelyticum]MBB5346589.1 glycosyltransferase involved in cell wall biosynthesis [Desulfoprunum benzoelyticum]MBM9528882.1 glycosyltransferase [Desulfoprunum benzoelyticum]